MKFSFVISCPPDNPFSIVAAKTATAVYESDNQLFRIFFTGKGVKTTRNFEAENLSENSVSSLALWHRLFRSGIDVISCSESCIREGLIDVNKGSHRQLASGVGIGGFAQLSEALSCSDRVLSFPE